ncbi:MAG: tandem-95 repeat protein, partial [Fidelibacterota bacterium]
MQSSINSDLSGDEQGLVGLWKFNSGSGDILYDHSGNQNHGSINGATWSTDVPPMPETYHISINGSDNNNGSEEAPYATIQYGINESSNGDTVKVSEGTYIENINFNGKNIVLIGDSKETTIIDGGQNGGVVTFNSMESDALIKNFTITNGLNFPKGGGILISDASPRLENLIVKDNVSDPSGQGGSGGGIFVEYSSLTSIKYVSIENNLGIQGGGLMIDHNSTVELDNCTIAGNTAESYGAISMLGSTLTMLNSIVWGNSSDNNQDLNLDGTATITYSNIQGLPSQFEGNGNISEDPIFVNPENHDYHLQASSPCIGAGAGPTFADLGAYALEYTPPIVSDMTFTIDEDEALNGIFSGDDADEQDVLTFSIVTEPSYGTVIIDDNEASSFTFTPSENYFGEDNFTFIASDGIDVSNTATVTITVNPVNDAPVIVYIENLTLTEDFQGDTDIRLEASDVDGDEVSFSSSSTDFVSTYIENQNIYVTLLPNWYGEEDISVYATDTEGLVGTETFTLSVLPVNDAPVGVVTNVATEEDNILISVLEAVDVEDDPVTFNFVDIKNGTVDLNSDNGAYIYTPNLDYNGLDTLTFTASDAVDTGEEAHIFIEVTSVNDAPLFSTMRDTAMDEDSELSLALSATDVDGDFLYYEVDEMEHINAYIFNDGDSILFVPEPNWNGVSNVTLHVMDSEGLSDMASFNLTVNSID